MIIELTNREHKVNSKILHRYKQESEINRNAFDRFREQYWKERNSASIDGISTGIK